MTEQNTRFYVVETKYVGPNPDQHIDEDVVEIQTEPERTNSSGEAKIQGWCGTTNDWCVNAHGEYPTLADAEAAVKEIFGDVRPYEDEGASDSVVKAYKPGLYVPMSAENTGDWCYDVIQEKVTLGMTGEQVDALIGELEEAANEEGYTLSAALSDMIAERQADLLEEAEETLEDLELAQSFRDKLGGAESVRDLLELIVEAHYFGRADTVAGYLAAKSYQDARKAP